MATMAVDFGTPRHDLPHDNVRFLDALRTIVARRHVLTKAESTRRYRTAEQAADCSTLRVAALSWGKVREEEYDNVILP